MPEAGTKYRSPLWAKAAGVAEAKTSNRAAAATVSSVIELFMDFSPSDWVVKCGFLSLITGLVRDGTQILDKFFSQRSRMSTVREQQKRSDSARSGDGSQWKLDK